MPRKKVLAMDEDPEEEFEWDKKKIAITLVLLIALIVGVIFGKKYILGDQASQRDFSRQAVQGISTPVANTSFLPSQEEIKQQVVTLEAKAAKLSVQDIASSSPQVQQILGELQKLPKSPGNAVKQACVQICNSL